jgi:D-methionine transport system substrate-binding protein
MTRTIVRMLRATGLLLAFTAAATADKPLKIAASAGLVGQLVSFAATLARDKGLDVKIVELTDWVTINEVVY